MQHHAKSAPFQPWHAARWLPISMSISLVSVHPVHPADWLRSSGVWLLRFTESRSTASASPSVAHSSGGGRPAEGWSQCKRTSTSPGVTSWQSCWAVQLRNIESQCQWTMNKLDFFRSRSMRSKRGEPKVIPVTHRLVAGWIQCKGSYCSRSQRLEDWQNVAAVAGGSRQASSSLVRNAWRTYSLRTQGTQVPKGHITYSDIISAM